MSKSCLKNVLHLLLSRFCLIFPTFIHSLSSWLLPNLSFVQPLSNLVMKAHKTIVGQSLDKFWNDIYVFSSTTLSLCIGTKTGQILDISCWTKFLSCIRQTFGLKIGHRWSASRPWGIGGQAVGRQWVGSGWAMGKQKLSQIFICWYGLSSSTIRASSKKYCFTRQYHIDLIVMYLGYSLAITIKGFDKFWT